MDWKSEHILKRCFDKREILQDRAIVNDRTAQSDACEPCPEDIAETGRAAHRLWEHLILWERNPL